MEFLLEEMAPIIISMEQKSFKSQFRFKHFDNVSSGFPLGCCNPALKCGLELIAQPLPQKLCISVCIIFDFQKYS